MKQFTQRARDAGNTREAREKQRIVRLLIPIWRACLGDGITVMFRTKHHVMTDTTGTYRPEEEPPRRPKRIYVLTEYIERGASER